MESAILKTDIQQSFDYISRYSNFPYYYNCVDKKYIRGLTANLKTDTSYVIVPVDFTTTLDGLAATYYGRPDYFWIIADFNRIQDPFVTLSDNFSEIKIPNMTAIHYKYK